MRTPLLLSLLAAVLAVPAAARAYERTGVPTTGVCLYLPDREVPWAAASPLGSTLPTSEALAAIRRSFSVWEAELCSDLSFREGDPVGPEIGFDRRGGNVTTVVFRDVRCVDVVPSGDPCWREESCANEFNCWDGDARQIALTTTTFSTCSGEMFDSDIEFNAAGFTFTAVDGPPCGQSPARDCVDTDLENTLVHEIGHVIGLDHSPHAEATMFASAPAGEVEKRDLAPDDVDGLCDLYPAGGPTLVCEPVQACPSDGGGGSDSGCAAASGTPAVAGVALALAALVVRRRRDRAGR